MSDFSNVDVNLDDDFETPTSYSSSTPAPALIALQSLLQVQV